MEFVWSEDGEPGEEKFPGEAVAERMLMAGKLCLEELNIPEERIEISISFVSGDEIRALNHQYRGKDQVTDVLSFPQFSSVKELPPFGVIALGDVVICKEQAYRQAEEYGHSTERELIYLFTHSVFHLLGYDHKEEAERVKMRDLEEKVMGQLGLER